MAKTDASSVTRFLYEIAGYPLQNNLDRLTFEVVLVDDHTRSDEIVGWLEGQGIGYLITGRYGDKNLRCTKIVFDNTLQAAMFKTRFV